MQDSSPAYQPALRWYSHTWRLALCLLVSLVAWSVLWSAQWRDHRPLFWLDLAVGLAAFGLVFLRRRWPFGIALVLAAAGAVSAVAIGPALLAAVSFATRRRIGRILALGVLWVLAAEAHGWTQPDTAKGFSYSVGTDAPTASPREAGLVAQVVVTSAFLGVGMYIGSRRELLWTLRERAQAAEADRDLRVATARANERAAIAREMHDVLAHRISRVSMQAGAIAIRGDLTAGELRGQVRVIQEQANAALIELRDILGVLREPDDGRSVRPPQPTYADLDSLVTEARQSGMNIEFHDRIDPRDTVSDAAGRTTFRIVQEGLTNARKHAPGALVSIELSGDPERGIDIVLRNALGFGSTATAAPGSGLGLIGLAERATVQGGHLTHARENAVFVLHGWIPWTT
ncbi:two-component sensor histidine kinase [Longispora fulva]|uniref:histidine kinase n=1 Tax=Longispora fulva TaxID=619741 RepID=A0A8J7KFS4_9ACTN|nr:histidine kinase [Longispora fulva]MBG6134089.1 signal transduction histidine kinase [Longispora fulva]GIG62463.1 two-component sensor histidine kinase [Longispora fulva]